MHSVFLLLFLKTLPGSSKSLFYLLLLSLKWVPPKVVPHPPPRKPTTLSSLPQDSVFGDGKWDRMRFLVGYIYTFWGSTFLFTDHIMYFFSFLIVMTIVYPQIKPLPDEYPEKRWLFFLEKVKFLHVTIVVLLYSFTFILTIHALFFFSSCYRQIIFH